MTVRSQDVVERAMELSQADGCIVIAQESSNVNLRWAGNTLTTNGLARSRELTVIATVGDSTGTAAGIVGRSNVGLDEVEKVVRLAEQSARANEAAEDAAPLVEGRAGADWAEAPEETSAAVLSNFSESLGQAFERARSAGRDLFGYAEHDVTTTYLGTSTGVRLRHVQPSGRAEITGKSAGRTRSSWVGSSTRDFTDVDALTLDDELARRLAWAERRVEVEPGRWTTLLPPAAVADLMVYLYWSSAARPAHEGRTVFSRRGGGTRVGDRLSEVPLTLRSDPFAPGIECSPFAVHEASGEASSVFDNGLPLEPTDWIRDGELNALITSRYAAAQTGLPLTPGIGNLLLSGSGATGSVEDLVAGTDRGLLLTCLWYIREVDPQTLLLTGLTRDGVYLVEGGEVVGEVTNFRFNESPVDLLGRVDGVTESTRTMPREWGDFFTRAVMPGLRVRDFNMSSTSDAS
jgi:predicted Zn-dependent protease